MFSVTLAVATADPDAGIQTRSVRHFTDIAILTIFAIKKRYHPPMYDNIRSNIFKQGTKILHSIVEHYEAGTIESPDANHLMMQLFALVAEDKVEGIVDEETGLVKWSLTEDFKKQVDATREPLSENVVKGPWA